MRKTLLYAALFATTATAAYAADFGEKTQQLAKALAPVLFGTLGSLDESSTVSLTAAQADADPAALLTVAKGLKVSVVSADANLGPNTDQMVMWPDDIHPTHIIACNEQGAGQVAVQRINLKTGVPENIISGGLTSCDPVRITPWGTVLAGEENGTNGRLFEILDPLHTTGVLITGAGASTTISDPAHVARLGAVGQFAFEGLALMPTGVLYISDENRPGTGGLGNPGGAIVKFIPDVQWQGGAPITDLAQSPLRSGTLWGMRIGRNGGNTDVGQGNEFGRGVWVQVPTSTNDAPTNLRSAALTLKLTSYYRPEDMGVDLAALKDGYVRFCGTNTGQDVENQDNHFGEVYCITDGTVDQAGAIATTTQTVGGVTYTLNTASVPEYQPLVIGNLDFAMMDNVAYQPGTGNWLVNEDGEGPVYATPRNNDIWDCLDDGDDDDNLTDACIKVMTLNDLNAESTGGFFDGTGKAYYVSIQHNVTGHGVILKVTGWRNVEEQHHGWLRRFPLARPFFGWWR
ncbi:MAG TPA: alkaline phosphatase PhoX [Gammaproteobacteria bacterium]|nr:alkaline phosphatase PhoX [Gammaproteobacteria bacterium]